jgi:hypothetical protein
LGFSDVWYFKLLSSSCRECNHYYQTRDNEEGGQTEELRVSPSVPGALSHTDLVLHSDIRLLAVSTHMTELSYAISDIQTRIFGT